MPAFIHAVSADLPSRRSALPHFSVAPSLTIPFLPREAPVVPWNKQKFLPDWPRTLAMSLARPDPPSIPELSADDWVGSEEMVTATLLLMATGISLDDAVILADEASVDSLPPPLIPGRKLTSTRAASAQNDLFVQSRQDVRNLQQHL